MNAKHLIATIALTVAAGSVFAQSKESIPADANFVSTKSRAEVIAELKDAYNWGMLGTRDGADWKITTGKSMMTNTETVSKPMPMTMPKTSGMRSDIYFGA